MKIIYILVNECWMPYEKSLFRVENWDNAILRGIAITWIEIPLSNEGEKTSIDQLIANAASFHEIKDKSSPPEWLLSQGVLKIYNKLTEEYPCWSVISVKLLWNFIEIAHWYGFSPIILRHIVRTTFYKKIYGWLLLKGLCNRIGSIMLLTNESLKRKYANASIRGKNWWQKLAILI